MRTLALILVCAAFLGCRTNISPRAQVDDLKITATVKSNLAREMGLSTVPNIAVNSTNGVVTLAGSVDTAAQRMKAESIARGVPQVTRVVDNLQVMGTASRSTN